MKFRWRVEQDDQELKGEIGLDHFEGRTWRGFYHHATLCGAAHAFLALRRALSPQSREKWALATVRPRLQAVLLRLIGYCPRCRRPLGVHEVPRGPSRV